ncbi:SusD/RagB family nutrient-binding outer membrane lipoprotein [Muricauda sp. 2012CJ35-5]|uniref:SusD/RagB family nutrient-binding outer membrane lipoprotein n=1 Tax=Flagellimonas spongiicola TaxID=2942208 RepID=A0ABT0PXA6_9FLAO|nr:SusD/RagB family nutrient-binding outer membrane lipoprotein [Allomuricauda spongiicola]MCL6275591.1 SusD/RagB family nutrient-binding outer membrane lipoprotein [Allomuricauda spongiicola]
MRKINKYLTVILSGAVLAFTACETTELDLTANPNALTPDQAGVDFYLSSIQEDFVRQFEGDADFDINDNWTSGGNTNGDGFNELGMQLTRILNMNGRNYNTVYQGSDMDDEWFNAYRGILADIRAMMPLAEEADLVHHIGIAQFIEAYLMISLVDFFGDVPYSEAIQGAEQNFNPALDSGASIYDAMLVLLDEAIVNFNATATAEPTVDFYYGNDYDKWVRAANTLKLKIYLQRRLVDTNAAASFNAIIAGGNYIQDTADDFVYNWPASSATQPDARHPRYGLNYQAAGANDYMSNWLMRLMDTSDDPRTRYFFYRQTDAVPGAEIAPNEELLNCSLEAAPQHYIDAGFGDNFCYLPNGFWGRDHGDADGVPPDGLLRTTFGTYPVGGRFDDDSFQSIGLNSGGEGTGITNLLTAFGVDLMRAEMALAAGNTGEARTFMLAGLTKNMAKVQGFLAGREAGADVSFAPSEGDVNSYITQVGINFDDADSDGKWDVLGEQFFIAHFGNGVDPYNFYRRTGFPTTLQPNLEPDPGTFIRSMYYPVNAVNNNSNISQKSNQSQPVFWDTNASGPVAN